MKVFALLALSALLGANYAFAADSKAPAKEEIPAKANKGEGPPLASQAEKVSYLFGSQVGASMKRDKLEVDSKSFMRGFVDALGGKDSQLTEEESQAVMVAFQKQMKAKEEAAASDAKKEGDTWLAENKKKEGVKVTDSGLQYKVIKDGTGAKPKLTDTVTAHYEGHLIDGKVFDSSYKRGEPAKFPVDGVIPGWTEALQLMKVGSKWELYIPSQLAYGEGGAGGDIGPNSALVFTIELIDTAANKPKIKIEQ